MANLLGMNKVNAVKELRRLGWSYSRIARELGIHRETVSRYVGLESKPTPNPTPESAQNQQNPTPGSIQNRQNPAPGSIQNRQNPAPGYPGPESECEPFREKILTKIDAGLTARRIWQDLLFEHGFKASYSSVKRYVKRLVKRENLPFRRIERSPGEEAQVDFGAGPAIITPDGTRRKTHIFRIVLSFSRKAYSEAVFRQDTESFIRAIENAFIYFGGVTNEVVIDNLKSGVILADWYDPDLNPKLRSFAEHYGTVILPTRPKTPRHKGKIERSVGYVKDNALKGRVFKSLAELNEFLLDWESRIADTRIHGTTKKQAKKLFDEIERAALRPPPVERFPFFHEEERSVHRDGHVEVEKSYYSAPPEYVGRKVRVRWDGRTVRMFNQRMEQIAVHAKQEPGRFSTQSVHISDMKISRVEKGAEWNLREASRIGPNAAKWATEVLSSRGIEGIRVLIGLSALARKRGNAAVDKACMVAASHGAYRLKNVRESIGSEVRQETLKFTEKHPIIRDLAEYDRIIRVNFREQGKDVIVADRT